MLTLPRRPLRACSVALSVLLAVLVLAGPKSPGSSPPTPRTSAAPKVAAGAADVRPTQLVADHHGHYRFGPARVTLDWLWLLHEARRAGWQGRLNGALTGLRTYQQQRQLHRLFVAGEGAPAFKPDGPSRHLIRNVDQHGGWYQAVDVTRPVGLIRAGRAVGVHLWQPYADEPWHVEARRPFTAPAAWMGPTR